MENATLFKSEPQPLTKTTLIIHYRVTETRAPSFYYIYYDIIRKHNATTSFMCLTRGDIYGSTRSIFLVMSRQVGPSYFLCSDLCDVSEVWPSSTNNHNCLSKWGIAREVVRYTATENRYNTLHPYTILIKSIRRVIIVLHSNSDMFYENCSFMKSIQNSQHIPPKLFILGESVFTIIICPLSFLIYFDRIMLKSLAFVILF